MQKLAKNKGITLIALVITIIVLLILAGISMATLMGENGLINRAQNAKVQTEVGREKEVISLAVMSARMENENRKLEETEFRQALNEIEGEGKTDLADIGDEFEVLFNESGRYYPVSKDGNIRDYQLMVKDEKPGDITTDKDGNSLKGDTDNPYEIWNIEDLVELSIMANGGNQELNINANNFKGKNIILKRNLDFKAISSYADFETKKYMDLNADGVTEGIKTELTKVGDNCIGFTPIGNSKFRFAGNFDGNGNEINNIYENSETIAGLFGYVESVTISNLGVSGFLNAKQGSAGGILAVNNGYSVNIINCYNKCNITAKIMTSYNGVGGLVGGGNIGSGNLNIINCYNEGRIELKEINKGSSGAVAAGGIIGNFRGGSTLNVYNCYNEGEIKSVSGAGGILAGTWAEGIINVINCCNMGNIDGTRIYNITATNKNANRLENCYYFENGKEGLDKAYTNAFNEETVNNVVDIFNKYVEDNRENENIKTNEWRKWKVKEKGSVVFDM